MPKNNVSRKNRKQKLANKNLKSQEKNFNKISWTSLLINLFTAENQLQARKGRKQLVFQKQSRLKPKPAVINP